MLIKGTVCKVFDLNEIRLPDASSLQFRVEIRCLKAGQAYDAIVYRLETFRVAPSFDVQDPGHTIKADHQFFVVDDFLSQFSFVASSEDETEKLVLEKISTVFEAGTAHFKS